MERGDLEELVRQHHSTLMDAYKQVRSHVFRLQSNPNQKQYNRRPLAVPLLPSEQVLVKNSRRRAHMKKASILCVDSRAQARTASLCHTPRGERRAKLDPALEPAAITAEPRGRESRPSTPLQYLNLEALLGLLAEWMPVGPIPKWKVVVDGGWPYSLGSGVVLY